MVGVHGSGGARGGGGHDGLAGGGAEGKLTAGLADIGRGRVAAAVEDAGHAGGGRVHGQPGAARPLVAAADQGGVVRPEVGGGQPGALEELVADPGQQDGPVRAEAHDGGAHGSIPAETRWRSGPHPVTMGP